MKQISTHSIQKGRTDSVVVFCIRNEKFRLPYFLEYYRKLGVAEFFAIDNGSTDDTQAYLLEQTDVHVFHTEASYKSSNAGRDWTSELADLYCQGRWCLTLDVDEYLLFPMVESSGLKVLTDYLDYNGYEGIFTLFLDFYSNQALSKTNYIEGDSPFDVCEYYDSAKSYACIESENFPYIMIKGGIRQRMFWDPSDHRSGPAMRKIPLVKWKKGFHYIHSTHSSVPIRLADVTGVLAHFKFLSHFKDFSRAEVERNDRISNSKDWKMYANRLAEEDIIFYDQTLSQKFEGSIKLMSDQLMSCSPKYIDFYSRTDVPNTDRVSAAKIQQVMQQQLLKHCDYGVFSNLWPAIALFNQPEDAQGISKEAIQSLQHDLMNVANSRVWKSTYRLRKWCSEHGLIDQRVVTEETFYNQRIDERVRYLYGSVWWDLLSPFRIILRIARKLGLMKRPR